MMHDALHSCIPVCAVCGVHVCFCSFHTYIIHRADHQSIFDLIITFVIKFSKSFSIKDLIFSIIIRRLFLSLEPVIYSLIFQTYANRLKAIKRVTTNAGDAKKDGFSLLQLELIENSYYSFFY